MVDMHEKAKEYSELIYEGLYQKALSSQCSDKPGLIKHAKVFLGMSVTKEYSGAYAYKADRAEELVDVAVQDGWFEQHDDGFFYVGHIKYTNWVEKTYPEEIKA